jgi:hypothetical protein
MGFWTKITLAFSLVTPVAAQQWIGVQAGLVNYAEGIFYIDQEQLQFPEARFREVAKGKSLRTGSGWVELQLGPGAFLWMGEEGVLQMEDPNLINTQLLIERGSILVEVYEQTAKNKISLRFGEAVIALKEVGTYRIDSKPPQLRVYYGKAEILAAGRSWIVKQGRAADLKKNPQVARFDTKQIDPLQQIAARRSALLSSSIQALRRQPVLAIGPNGQSVLINPASVANEQQRRIDMDSAYRDSENFRNYPPPQQDGHPQPQTDIPRQQMEQIGRDAQQGGYQPIPPPQP